jgi:hypothetical protein
MDWLTASGFGGLSAKEKVGRVEQMEQDGSAGYRLIKQTTVFAFYTSRAGLIDNLEYQGNAYLTDFPACTHPEHRRV